MADKDKRSVPADVCWGVPMTICAAALFLCLLPTSTGLTFVLIIDIFSVEREKASWPESIFAMAVHISAMENPTKQDGRRRALLLLGTPAFYALLISIVIGDYNYAEFSKTIVDYGIDKGLDRNAAGNLMTYSSVGQLMGRVGLAILADVAPSCRSPLFVLSFLISCASFVALPHVYTFSPVAILSVVQGIGQGYVASIKYVLVAEHVGIPETPACFGVAGAVFIPLTLVSPLITGFGVGMFSVSAAMYILPYFDKYKSITMSILYGTWSQTGKHDAQKEPTEKYGCSMRRAALLFRIPAFYVLLIAIVVGDYIASEFVKTIVDYGIDKGLDLAAAPRTLPCQHSWRAMPDKDKHSMPPDRCWGVPLTMCAAAFFLCILPTSAGLIFVLIMDTFGVEREQASWPDSVFAIALHISGLAVYALQLCFKTYHIVLLSTVLASLSVVATAFVPNVLWMTVTFGAMHGMGFGIFCMSAAVYIMLYFDKYRSIATSLTSGVWAVTGIISPYVLTSLTETYGARGAFLLFGGIVMHSTAMVMLSKNPQPMGRVCGRSQTASRPITTDPRSPTREHTIVDYGIDKGLDSNSAGKLVTFSSVGQLVGRIGLAILADVAPSARSPLYAISFLISGVCFVAVPHAYPFSSLAVLSVVQGIGQGYIASIKYVLVAEHVGIPETPACFGIAGAIFIPLTLVSPFLTGYFRDTRGSYDNYYRLQGAFSLVAALAFGTFYLWKQARRGSVAMNESEVASPHE
ncbi:hypothetical protein MTO96_025449 [Rhipicephalus appendiculatus]